MAVTAPVLTPLPPPPLPTDAEADFDAKAGDSLSAQVGMVVEINASLTWIATQVNAAEGYASSAATSAQTAGAAANSAAAIAAALDSQAGLPSMVGNGRRALAVLANEQGVSYQTQIKLISIEPLNVANAAGAVALNVGAYGVFNLTLTAAATLSLSNLPALSSSESMVLLVRISQGVTAYAITWPGSIVWLTAGSIAPPTPNAGKRVEYILTIEGGTIYGRRGASN